MRFSSYNSEYRRLTKTGGDAEQHDRIYLTLIIPLHLLFNL